MTDEQREEKRRKNLEQTRAALEKMTDEQRQEKRRKDMEQTRALGFGVFEWLTTMVMV